MRMVVAGALLLVGCSFSADYGGTRYQCEAGVCPAGFVCAADGYCRPEGGADAAATIDADPASPDSDPGTPDASVAPDPPWWNTDWTKRRRITVHNVAGATLANGFEVGFFVDIESLIGGGPYGQIRVMHYNPNTDAWAQMTRVIDELRGTDEVLWLPLWEDLPPDQIVDHYWLYYGNDAAGAADSNPADLFSFYAPFVATDNRLEFNGTATVSNGDLNLGADSNLRTLSPYRWGAGYAVDFEMTVPTWDQRFWGGFQRVDDYVDDEPWIIWISRGPGATIWPEFLAYDSGSTTTDEGTAVSLDTAKYLYSIERFPTATVYRREHVQVDRLTHGSYTADMQVRLANESGNTILFDMIRVRRASDPPPEVTLGPEELLP